MTTDISTFSHRARQFLDQKSFAVSSEIAPSFQWKIEYSGGPVQFQTDKILTLQYSHPVEDPFTSVFLESFCKLAQGKTFQSLSQLSFREMENFLRDENHIPAFGEAGTDTANSIFHNVKNALLAKILLTKMNESGLRFDLSGWKTLSLSGKNKAIMDVFSGLARFFPGEKAPELILAEGETITVKKNDFPLELSVLETFLGSLITGKETDSPLKVIGTL